MFGISGCEGDVEEGALDVRQIHRTLTSSPTRLCVLRNMEQLDRPLQWSSKAAEVNLSCATEAGTLRVLWKSELSKLKEKPPF